ncbi:MAG: PhzF family phenazine biosynthesis protein [Betaproteobacteria bacterium]
MARYHFFTLDVFTGRQFGGNPLAVVLDAERLGGDQMQAIAAEFNLSETVFVLPPAKAHGAKKLRIFTPRAELPFAGHPTVGTAFLLAKLGLVLLDTADPVIVLEEGVGNVAVDVQLGPDGPRATRMSVPKMPELGPEPPPAQELAAMLSLSVNDLLPGRLPRAYSCGVPFLFVPVRDREAIARAKIRPDLWEKTVSRWWASSVFVFTFDTEIPEAQVHARMFAPAFGVVEDPATGGAAAALAGFLCELERTDGSFRWQIEQGLEIGRPSLIELEADVVGGTITAVRVGGRSVLVSEGWINLD